MIKYIDLHYIGNIKYYKNIIILNRINFALNAPYLKGGNANKCTIVGANGLLNLSIPLVGGRNQKALNGSLQISYEQDWQTQHLKSIQSCYGNAPFFDYYYPIFEQLIMTRFEKLYQLNLEITNKILKLLKVNNSINIDTETIINPKEILFSKLYFKENPQLNDSNIPYPQVFEDRLGFVSNLSIIDLLMCLGPEAKNYLQKA